MREMINMLKEERYEELEKATTEINKIVLKRLLITIPLLGVAWWALQLGRVSTPLGEVNAILWMAVWIFIGNIGGVLLGGTKGKATKED